MHTTLSVATKKGAWMLRADAEDPVGVDLGTTGGELWGSRATLDALLRDLDRRHPGFRFRVVDEQGRLRRHLRIFVKRAEVRDLATTLDAGDEVQILHALSGG